jgi:hypothetical protein
MALSHLLPDLVMPELKKMIREKEFLEKPRPLLAA